MFLLHFCCLILFPLIQIHCFTEKDGAKWLILRFTSNCPSTLHKKRFSLFGELWNRKPLQISTNLWNSWKILLETPGQKSRLSLTIAAIFKNPQKCNTSGLFLEEAITNNHAVFLYRISFFLKGWIKRFVLLLLLKGVVLLFVPQYLRVTKYYCCCHVILFLFNLLREH